MALAGKIPRGKYTFVSKFALDIKTMQARDTEAEKKLQGTSAASTKSEYGTPDVDGRSTRPKTPVKMIMGRSGCRITHSAPNDACRYRRRMSRTAKCFSRDTNSQYSANTV